MARTSFWNHFFIRPRSLSVIRVTHTLHHCSPCLTDAPHESHGLSCRRQYRDIAKRYSYNKLPQSCSATLTRAYVMLANRCTNISTIRFFSSLYSIHTPCILPVRSQWLTRTSPPYPLYHQPAPSYADAPSQLPLWKPRRKRPAEWKSI